MYGGGLQPAEDAQLVDATGAEPVISDGPFPEAKEHLGGFWIIEAPTRAVAVEIATEASRVSRLPLEVREFHAR